MAGLETQAQTPQCRHPYPTAPCRWSRDLSRFLFALFRDWHRQWIQWAAVWLIRKISILSLSYTEAHSSLIQRRLESWPTYRARLNWPTAAVALGHSLSEWFSHLFAAHFFIEPFVRLLKHSLLKWLAYRLAIWPTEWLTHAHTHSRIHSLIHSFVCIAHSPVCFPCHLNTCEDITATLSPSMKWLSMSWRILCLWDCFVT